jgi:glycosyltransferase involved in cell wall biosynthesis
MRILLLCTQFHFIGGIAEFVDNLASELMAAGHHVEVVCTDYARPGSERAPKSQIKVQTVQIPASKKPSMRHPERFFRWPDGREFSELVKRLRPDIVNSHINQWNKYPAIVKATENARVPLVQTIQDCYGGDRSYPAPLRSLSKAAMLCVLTASVADGLEKFLPRIKSARVMRGGVNCAEAARTLAFNRSRPYLLTASRLELSAKALDVVLGAFAAIAQSYPELDLVVAGEGSDRASLQTMTCELGLGARVEFTGAVSRAKLWSLYKGAKFFVMASRRPEGLGLVFLESMACGRPVIGSNSGGVPEVVRHGEHGLLVDRNEVDQFRAAMEWMLVRDSEREEMGRRALTMVQENYDWPRVAERYVTIYEEAMRIGKRE